MNNDRFTDQMRFKYHRTNFGISYFVEPKKYTSIKWFLILHALSNWAFGWKHINKKWTTVIDWFGK